MTTYSPRDWKVTTGYRVLLRFGWALIAFAVYLGGVASLFDSTAVWWIVAGIAVVVIFTSLLLPEPVPRDMITGHRNHISASAVRR